LVLALALSNCMTPVQSTPEKGEGPPESRRPVSTWGRELGTLTAIYPIPNPDGGYSLELRLTKDTVMVDLDSLRSFASDSLGKVLIRSTVEHFYTLNERCFFSPRKEACLEFRDAADSPADGG
jgi:hypothetical protein